MAKLQKGIRACYLRGGIVSESFEKAWNIVKFSDDPEKLRDWGDKVREYQENPPTLLGIPGTKVFDADMEKPISWSKDKETGEITEDISECAVADCDRFSPDGGVCERCSTNSYNMGSNQCQSEDCDNPFLCQICNKRGGTGIMGGESSAYVLCDQCYNLWDNIVGHYEVHPDTEPDERVDAFWEAVNAKHQGNFEGHPDGVCDSCRGDSQ